MRSQDLSPRMLRSRVAALQAQARLDAMDGSPASRAWADLMDTFWHSLVIEQQAEALYNEASTTHTPAVPFSAVSLFTRERWLAKAQALGRQYQWR